MEYFFIHFKNKIYYTVSIIMSLKIVKKNYFLCQKININTRKFYLFNFSLLH